MGKDMTNDSVSRWEVCYGPLGWVSNRWLIGKRITFDYDGQTFTAPVLAKDSERNIGYCSFTLNGKQYCKCPFKLLSGLGFDEADKFWSVLYHPERNVYAFARDICIVTGMSLRDVDYVLGSNKCTRFYNEDAKAAHSKAERIVKSNRESGIRNITAPELSREIYHSRDESGNYRCHVSGVVMDLKDLNSDHCHCTGKYMGLVTPEVNSMEGQLKKLLGLKGIELTHEERLDLIRGMLQGAEKMHNKRLMKVWENTVTSKGLKKISTQQSTLMQLSLDL